jgi:REP element-mobilizing transposase RayT
MSRPLRVEFPGALYHVTSRGDRREAIYLDDADRQQWLTLFGQVCQRFNWICHAYCLMDNHFHIVVETIDGNLSAGMRQLNGVYTQWHNRAHGRVGHVFQGRFKAVLVQRESYLLELARYVVLNPVRAGLCALPELWPWSSYRATVGIAAPPEWLQTAWLLSQFGRQLETASDAYIGHVRAGMGLPSVWAHLKSQLYLGDDDFCKALQPHTQCQAGQTEIPKTQRRAAAPPLAHFATLPERNTAMAQAYATGCYSLKEIAQTFGLHYATVSRAVRAAESTAGNCN